MKNNRKFKLQIYLFIRTMIRERELLSIKAPQGTVFKLDKLCGLVQRCEKQNIYNQLGLPTINKK